MGKAGIIVVALVLLLSGRCYGADFNGALAGMPFVGPMVAPTAPDPAYLSLMGTPAPVMLPTTDPAKWFATDANADPYDPTKWAAIGQFLAAGGDQAGWTEVCKKIASAAGADRSANPQLGALACSGDPSVTRLQQLAVGILQAQAAVALWIKGAPGGSIGAIQGYQGQVRLFCTTDISGRQPADSPLAQACAKALDTAYLSANDGKTTFTALGDAYTLAATALATMAPKVAQAPVYFGAATATKTP